MNITLGLDTSTTGCSAALLADGAVTAARFEEMATGQAERLNPMIAEVLAEAGIGFADITRIAVTTGPGAFTGLRIGLACARALALATGAALVGVTTFAALARAVAPEERRARRLAVCVNAKRRDVFVQAFDEAGAPSGAPFALAPEGMAGAFRHGDWLLAGDGVAVLAAALAKTGEAGEAHACRLRVSAATAPPDARHVAALGAEEEPAARPVRPFYIRPPDVRLPGAR